MPDAADPSSPSATPELHRLSPRDESRGALALTLRQLADAVLDAVPVEPETEPGDLLRTALKLQRRTEDVVREGVVAERERGTTWAEIGEVAGVTRQSAHEKWYGDVHAWAAIGRSALPPHLKTLEVAAEADARYAGLRPNRPHAVTSGLDAVRFPGSHAYEASLRVRGSALHTRRTKLDARATKLNEAYSALHEHGPPTLPSGTILSPSTPTADMRTPSAPTGSPSRPSTRRSPPSTTSSSPPSPRWPRSTAPSPTGTATPPNRPAATPTS
ncbi:hypothetical protein OG426_20235 [Streptomyces canus]|uniref:hypothetical protein n=1 Tax=Streptomyces canus TaxID=58343 RepID=UPI00386D15CF|nr:hypothetical protein OG426_20235 [Streptomyces canus]